MRAVISNVVFCVLTFTAVHAIPSNSDLKIESVFHCHSNRNRNSNSSLVELPRSALVGDLSAAGTSDSPLVYLRVEGTLDCKLEANRTLLIPRYNNETTSYYLKSYFLSQNGSLWDKKEVYSTSEFCASEISDEFVTIRFCKQPDAFQETKSPAIRKCCPSGEIYDLSQYAYGKTTCVPSTEPTTLEPSLYDENGIKTDKNLTEGGIQLVPLGKGWCKSNDQTKSLFSQQQILDESPRLFRTFLNGSVAMKSKYEDWTSLREGNFCLEHATNFPTADITNATDLIVIVCNSPRDDTKDGSSQSPASSSWKNWVTGAYALLVGTSCIFLLLTVAVHLALWDKQNIHSWTVLCSALSMTGWYSSLLVTYFYTANTAKNSDSDLFCTCLAVTTHFFILLTFSWITLISFDIWSTFRNLRMVSRKAFQWKRFLCYSIFAFSVPTLVVSIGLILDHFYKNDLESGIVTPSYGGLKCYMNIQNASLQYLYSPVAILMIANIVFFITTIWTLYQIRESTRVATSTTQVSHSEKNSFLLFTKLFFVMGGVWILELGAYFVFLKDPTHPLVIITDTLHCLQPAAIFVIFVCKKDVLRGLQQRYACLKKLCRICSSPKRRGNSAGGSVQTDDTHVSNSSASTRSRLSISSFTSSLRFQSWKKPHRQELSVANTQPPDVQV